MACASSISERRVSGATPARAFSTERRRGRRAGFTILELSVVLLAIAFTAALSITAYFSRGEVTLDSAATLLTEDLRAAQARAALMRRPVMFHFDRDGGGYETIDMPRSAQLAETERPGPRRLYDRDGVFEGVRITRVDVAGRDHVLFQPDGSVAFGGRITLGFEGESRTVELESGRSWIRIATP